MPSRFEGTKEERRALDAYIKLMRCTNVLEGRLQRELATRDMTLAQLAVLEALLHLGALSQGELARKMLRSGGSVTSVVDHLEEKGLVRRERSEEDRRVVHVHLTPGGRRLIARVFPSHARDIAETLGRLTAAEQEELGRLCKKLGLGSD